MELLSRFHLFHCRFLVLRNRWWISLLKFSLEQHRSMAERANPHLQVLAPTCWTWILVDASPRRNSASSSRFIASGTDSSLKNVIKASPFRVPLSSLYNLILGCPVDMSSMITPHFVNTSFTSSTVVSKGMPVTYTALTGFGLVSRFCFLLGWCSSC